MTHDVCWKLYISRNRRLRWISWIFNRWNRIFEGTSSYYYVTQESPRKWENWERNCTSNYSTKVRNKQANCQDFCSDVTPLRKLRLLANFVIRNEIPALYCRWLQKFAGIILIILLLIRKFMQRTGTAILGISVSVELNEMSNSTERKAQRRGDPIVIVKGWRRFLCAT